MSYERKYGQYCVPNGTGVLAADDLSATGVHGEYLVMRKVNVDRLYALITTAVVSTGAVVIAFKARSAPGVTAGQVTIASVSVPAGSAVGKVVYKDGFDPYEMNPGQALAIEVTTAAAGGGAAGGAVYGFEFQDSPEQPANITSMVESA